MLTSRTINILDRLIDCLPYSVMVDNDGYIVKITKGYADYLGVDTEQAVGSYITDIVPNSGLPRVLSSGKEIIGEVFKLKNGEENVVSRYPIFDVNGKLIGAISTAIFDNTTELKKLHRKIEYLESENEDYRTQLERLRNEDNALKSIIGTTQIMTDLKRELERIAKTDAGVLITGESGTGKEIFANAIHQLSDRAAGPYVKINCAAIPTELMESELFGYEGGSFSGANKSGKPGKFELANHGTLLLDEIGEMPMAMQSKLLRVLQDQEIERVGSTKPTRLDIRIICSTNRDLEQMVKDGLFRLDLYYRINVLEINIPPLRDRKADIPQLCEMIIHKNNIKNKTSVVSVSDTVLKYFYLYDWPGNIRELQHILERACIAAKSGEIKLEHMGSFVSKIAEKAEATESIGMSMNSIYTKRGIVEREEIKRAMDLFNGNKTQVAKYLEISRSTLYEKLKQYNL